MTTRTTAATLVLFLGMVAGVAADSRITFKATEGQGSTVQSVLIGHGKVRVDADKTSSIILDPEGRRMILLEHNRKVFIRLTRQDVEQLIVGLAEMEKKMEATMATMPPEMRERMKAMMSQAGPSGGGATEVVETTERGTAAGKPCVVFRVSTAGRVTNESCMGEPSAIDLSVSDRRTLAAALALSNEIMNMLPKGPLATFVAGNPLRGGLIPLRSTDFAANGTRNTSEFAGVVTESIPAETFAAPEGYKEQKLDLPRIGRQ